MTDLSTLSDEHRELRTAIRAVVEAKIAPFAAAVDEEARFPHEAAADQRPAPSATVTSESSTA